MAIMSGKQTLHAALAVAILAMTTAALPATASAEERYSDEDSGYLRVSSRVVQPVANILENVFFKPFTAFTAWSDPVWHKPKIRRSPRFSRLQVCTGLRPHRGCSGGR
jgi:hypothetical protein